MHLGFTGSSEKVTLKQRATLEYLLHHLYFDEGFKVFHHGDCIVADEIAAWIAKRIGYAIYTHPPIFDYKRAFFPKSDVNFYPKQYLDRNKDIVNSSSLIIGVSDTDEEILRSGTWATLRYSRKMGKPRIILLP